MHLAQVEAGNGANEVQIELDWISRMTLEKLKERIKSCFSHSAPVEGGVLSKRTQLIGGAGEGGER